MEVVKGFSKLPKAEKIALLERNFFDGNVDLRQHLSRFWLPDEEQSSFEQLSENTISNFHIPYGVVPNLLLNDKLYCVPMAIEESSVVAAAAKSVNFWLRYGGFHAEVVSMVKTGQIHCYWDGDRDYLLNFFNQGRNKLIELLYPMTANMNLRGGGIRNLSIANKPELGKNYYQIAVEFETCDAMGANFINTVLEALGREFKTMLGEQAGQLQIVMAILSNYTPDCLVRAYVECDVDRLDFSYWGETEVDRFVDRFNKAILISRLNVERAVTHNKGIFNGVDAVVIATGNDFRAVEACGHAYAARDGVYRGLTSLELKDNKFRYSLELPLALGTVGGLTSLHSLARLSLKMLGEPSARELMSVVAAMGLAQNFAAVCSLITCGIQKGHMKMHLSNIMNSLNVNESEREYIQNFFADKTVSFSAVRQYLSEMRK